MSVAVYIALCPACIHGWAAPIPCDDPMISESAAGGITCTRYRPAPPRPQDILSVEHLMALPDREPCAECACWKGTVPNETHHSMIDFTASVENREPFLCHGEGRGRICAGWLRAAKARHAK